MKKLLLYLDDNRKKVMNMAKNSLLMLSEDLIKVGIQIVSIDSIMESEFA